MTSLARQIVAISAFVFSLAPALSLFAQEYRSDPVDRKARSQSVAVQRVVKGQTDYNAEKARFDEFFQKGYFPSMTGADPKSLEELGKLRVELFTKHLWATSNEQLQRDLTAMAYRAMAPVVVSKGEPTYHPAVRYNAILVIGLLDEQYAIESGANRRPPKPLPDANTFLVQVLAAANADKAIPPSLVVGALVGLDRHAKYQASLPPDAVAKMTSEILKLANRETPIAGVSRDVFRWIQTQAAGALANLGTVGPENQIYQTIVKLAGDEKFGLDNRLAVAALLKGINFEGATVDGKGASDALFAVARQLSTAEAKRAKEFEDLSVGGMIGMPSASYGREGGGGYGGGGGAVYGRGGGGYGGGGYGGASSLETGPKYARREVLARVMNLRDGLAAVKAIAPPESQSKIDEIVAAIGGVVTAAGDKAVVELEVVAKVRDMLEVIDRNVGAPEPADDAALEDAFAGAMEAAEADPEVAEEGAEAPLADDDAPAATPPAAPAAEGAEQPAAPPVDAPPADAEPADAPLPPAE